MKDYSKNYVKVGYCINCGVSYSYCKAMIEAINKETSLNEMKSIPMIIENSPSGRWFISPVFKEDIKRLNNIYQIIENR